MRFRLKILAPLLAFGCAAHGWLLPGLALLGVWVIIEGESWVAVEYEVEEVDDEE